MQVPRGAEQRRRRAAIAAMSMATAPSEADVAAGSSVAEAATDEAEDAEETDEADEADEVVGTAAAAKPAQREAADGRSADGRGGDGHTDVQQRLSVRETFERVASERSHQMMSTALTTSSAQWRGARCSAGVDKGRVGWTVRWGRGEVAMGFGCIAAPVSKPGIGRFAFAIAIAEDGSARLVYAGESRALAWPPLRFGDSVGLHLDLEPTSGPRERRGGALLFISVNGQVIALDCLGLPWTALDSHRVPYECHSNVI